MLRDGRPEENRLDPARMRGDPLESCQLARRLDGDGSNPCADRGTELILALARAGHHDAVRGDAGSQRRGELATRCHVCPEPEPADEVDDRGRRVRLDRVCQLDPYRQGGTQDRDLSLDDIEVIDVERGPEAIGELGGDKAGQPARSRYLVAGRWSPTP